MAFAFQVIFLNTFEVISSWLGNEVAWLGDEVAWLGIEEATRDRLGLTRHEHSFPPKCKNVMQTFRVCNNILQDSVFLVRVDHRNRIARMIEKEPGLTSVVSPRKIRQG